MRLHVLTAVTRPGNLGLLAESIAAASIPEVGIVWHWCFDPERTAVGGQRLKNEMLDQISDGWVCFLDDDNVMHPDFVRRVHEHKDADAVVVCQQRHSDGRTLVAGPGELRVG